MDLAFDSKEFGALQMISADVDKMTDPVMLQRCATFFIQNSQFDRAVDLLAAAKKVTIT
jgi:intraflagellar transport protein 140